MKNNYFCGDIIAAQATGSGVGAIAIVRMSGEGCFGIALHFFSGSDGKGSVEPRHIYHGFWRNESSQWVDEVQVVFYKAPASFTAEDMVEIYTHGGFLPAKLVLESLFEKGVRPAEAGEFTFRAFLHHKLDLIGAQTINSLIRTFSPDYGAVLAAQLHNKNHNAVYGVRECLLRAAATLEVEFDYPDEDRAFDAAAFSAQIQSILLTLDDMIEKSEKAEHLNQGLKVVLCGKPNVGKSTFLNYLIGDDRAIVSELPGTTRDFIQESYLLKGILIQLIDTAGLRKAEDTVEKIGIQKTLQVIEKANLVVYLLDLDSEFTQEDCEIFLSLQKKKTIVLINKMDKYTQADHEKIHAILRSLGAENRHFLISALTGAGVDDFREAIHHDLSALLQVEEGTVAVHPVQLEIFKRISILLKNGNRTYQDTLRCELFAQDIKEAIELLDTITGQTFDEDLIHAIFSNFCVGK